MPRAATASPAATTAATTAATASAGTVTVHAAFAATPHGRRRRPRWRGEVDDPASPVCGVSATGVSIRAASEALARAVTVALADPALLPAGAAHVARVEVVATTTAHYRFDMAGAV